jgi:hypothetical protein
LFNRQVRDVAASQRLMAESAGAGNGSRYINASPTDGTGARGHGRRRRSATTLPRGHSRPLQGAVCTRKWGEV